MKEVDIFGNEIYTYAWEKEWKGMPEFIQEKKTPYAKIIIRCETEKDLNELSLLLKQKLTNKTKSIWFPFRSHWGAKKGRWINDA